VLAQAGEGSVRDSLSALDQAIACCGNKLKAEEIRSLLGSFSIDSLDQVTQALRESSSTRMLEITDNLVRNGSHLQHFVRELARYFRNLLVTKIAASNPRLVAASKEQRERLAAIAAGFSEQDLTRYLQLTLDLFRDLQFSLQPRLHFELGLIRLVEAGKLISIEEALAGAGGPVPPPAPASPSGKKSAPPTPATPPPAAPAPGGLKDRLAAALRELGMAFTADAVEHSALEESAGTLQFTTPAEFELAMRPADVQKALEQLGVGKRRVKVSVGGTAAPTAAPAATPRADEDETMRRALENPEVQRVREVFPGAEVRVARNLRE